MILSEKIMNLRKQRGWSQEELAEKMGVSRQSVSKWEAGQSLPDIEKIIKLGDVFEVSVDYLVKDEMDYDNSSNIKEEPESVVRIVSVEDANEYMELIRITSKRFGGGVMAIILSVIPLLVLGAHSEAGTISENAAAAIGMGILFVVIAVSVAVFIINAMKLSPYEYLEKEEIKLQYGVEGIVEKRKKDFAHTFRCLIAIGVTLCIIGIVPLLTIGVISESDLVCAYMLGVMLAMIAVATYLFICAGMTWDSYNKLLQTDDYTPEKKHRSGKHGAIATIYWCSVTAIYLLISFSLGNWGDSWIIWPVAGVAFGALMGVMSLLGKNGEDKHERNQN